MSLADGYTDLPAGKIANIQTCLEMHERPQPRTDPLTPPCSLRRVAEPGLDWYRSLFREVGTPYLWFSRLLLSDGDLREIIHHPDVQVYVLETGGEQAGLLELDFREPNQCELKFFGLTQNSVGHGMGRWLMNRAIELAWERPISRFWVHTCTLDHPAALAFYIRSGFVPFKRQIEIDDDPRVTGVLPRSAAPDVPIL